jgi:hypothetical protein
MYKTNKILNLKIIKNSKYPMKYNTICFFFFFWVCPHHDPNNMADFFTKFFNTHPKPELHKKLKEIII